MTHHRWLAGIGHIINRQHRRRRTQRDLRAPAAELLETKVLLTANTLGLIQGTVFNDVTGNGLSGGDPLLNAVNVQLYRDGGNLTFDNGGADDTLLGAITTGPSGTFSFSDLAEGRYFVRQQPVVGYMQRVGENVVTVNISAANALGAPGILIDDFSLPGGPGQTLFADAAGIATASSFSPAVTAIGGERDMVVTATLGSIAFEANGAVLPGNLTYNANIGATGRSRVVWDGADNNSTTLNPSGLAGTNLTALGETGFLLTIGTSQPITFSLLVHTGPADSSTATVNLPTTGTDSIYVPYSSFVTTTGSGADFSNVGAIEFLTEAPTATTSTATDLIRAQSPTRFTVNFANFVPMTLGNLVFNDVNNNGLFDSSTEVGINGVAMTLFEDTNSNNVFDSGTDLQVATTTTAGGGLYSFGNLFPGNYLVRINASNFGVAGVLQGFQSSTGNGAAPDADVVTTDNDDNGDALGSAILSLGITLSNGLEPVNDGDTNPNTNLSLDFGVFTTVDIVVTKTDNADPVIAGSSAGNLVYTVTATNSGPGSATGVTISDSGVLAANLPAGVTFVSAVGSNGSTFNTTDGVWTIGALASGEVRTLVVTLTVGASASETLVITNTASLATVNEIEVDVVQGNDSSTERTNVDRSVDIAVAKVAVPVTVTAGSGVGNLVFIVSAHNIGPSNASGVSISDVGILAGNLPAGVTFVSAVGSGSTTFNSTTGAWTIGNLSTAGSETLTVTLTVSAAAANNLAVNNTASLTTVNETDRNLTNNSQTVVATVTREVDIQVTKSATPTSVIAGSGPGNLVYTLTARNIGASDSSGVTISDTDIQAANLPAGVTLVSAVGSGNTTYSAATGIWSVGNLAAGASATLTVTLTVGASASDKLIINNTAALASVNQTDTVSTNNSQAVTTNVDRSIDLAVTKSTVNNPVIAGSGTGNLVYTITTRNIGPSNASGVTVRDYALLAANLPVGVTLVSAISDGGSTYDAATGIWTIGNLAATDTRTLTVTVTVGATAVPQTFTNTVEVTGVNEIDVNLNNNIASATTMFNRSVDIQVTKTANAGPVIAGSGVGNLVYIVNARNNGPSNATGVAVDDTGVLVANLPAGVTFVSAMGSNGSTFNSTTGLWTIGNIASNASATLTVTLTVGASASDSLTISNTAALSTVTETDSNLQNNMQTVTTDVDRRVDIVVTKAANVTSVSAGSGAGNLVYTVTARNAGSSNATAVTISDPGVVDANLPAGVSFVSAVGSNGSTFNSTSGIWTIGSLAAGALETLTITLTVGVTVVDGVIINNTAAVATVTETETNLLNNTQSIATAVIGAIDLVVVKTGAPNPVLSPGLLTYTVRVANTGTGTATGVVLTDNLGPGMTFSSGTSTQGTVTYANGIVTTTIGTLRGGASATLTLVASVNVAIAGTLVNTASATADQNDPDPDDNTTSIQTQALLSPASVSGVVFQDLNRNGIRDSGERPISGVQIVLFGTDVNGASVNTQMRTDANGAYSFVDLEPGLYNVYEIQPGLYLDGNEVAGTGATATVVNDAFLNMRLNPGVNATGFNFTEGIEDPSKRPFLASSQNVGESLIVSLPVTGSGSLSGMVATDSNRNSLLDSGDIGIPGVIVSLAGSDAAGNPVLIHQSTDSLGRYSFASLPTGQYSIRETQPKGKTDGPEQPGTILPDQVLDDVFSAISLPNGGVGTGYNFLELPATAGTTTATSPTLLTPTTNNVGLRPTISWTPMTSAARYDVSVLQIVGNKGEVYRNQNVSGTSITIPNDLALGAHRVWVRSVNAAGVSGPWSQPLSFNVATQANALAVQGVSMNARPTLDWADVPNANSYDMRLINVETGTVLANVSSLTSSQYSGLSTLPPGKYRYFVRGNTASATGQWSDGYDYTILSIPTLKTVTATNTATPTLHWNPVIGAVTYEVYLSDLSATGGAKRIASVDKTNATSMPVPTGLALGNYRYWVRAIDSQGKMTSWSSPTDFKVETAGKITGPVGTTNTATPTITWKQVAGAVRYDVWVADKSGNVYLRDQNVTGTSYTPSKAFLNGDYRVWVMPIGTTASGQWSFAADFTVKVTPRPTLTSPGATSNSTPTFKWTASTGAVRYELWVDRIGGASSVIHQTNVATNSYKPAMPLASGMYRAWVRAFDSAGIASVWSASVDFRVV